MIIGFVIRRRVSVFSLQYSFVMLNPKLILFRLMELTNNVYLLSIVLHAGFQWLPLHQYLWRKNILSILFILSLKSILEGSVRILIGIFLFVATRNKNLENLSSVKLSVESRPHLLLQ